MALKGCRCRICRMQVDLTEIEVRLNAEPDLKPETLAAIEEVVKAAYLRAVAERCNWPDGCRDRERCSKAGECQNVLQCES